MASIAAELTTVWSPKGGSGATVVTAAMAIGRAFSGERVLLVDLCGDMPAVLGMATPTGPGITDWLADPEAADDAIARLVVPVTDELSLLPAGCARHGEWTADRADALASALSMASSTAWPGGNGTLADSILVDAGRCGGPATCGRHDSLVAGLVERGRSLMVTRSCYLALRAAMSMSLTANGVVLVSEPGRSLDERDVGDVLSLPVVANVSVDPAIARTVDAGLLVRRLPRSLHRALVGLW